jgi:predicted amidophosphoribosyltransferase
MSKTSIWRGDDIGRCEDCGKRIKITNNRGKYCNECWKERQKEWQRESMKKIRQNNKM